MGMWCSSNHFRTPTWASPSAPPPSRATPILGRLVGAGFVSVAGAMDCWGIAGGSWAKQGHVRKSAKSAGSDRRTADPFWFVARRRNSLRSQCYLCFVEWQASNSPTDDSCIAKVLRKCGLDVALVFRMALAMGEAYAGEDEQSAEDLGEAERFAEEDRGHGGGERALGEQADGSESRGKMAERVREEEIAAKLRDEAEAKDGPDCAAVWDAQ